MAVATKTKLAFKAPKAAAPSRPKILLFGKPGVGKTWFALDFPNVAYLDTEGGANLSHYTDKLVQSGGMYLGPEDGTRDPAFVLDQFKALASEKHQFKTVVLDSLSKTFTSMIATEGERLEKANEKVAFGNDKKPAVGYVRRLISWVDRMDMNVIFICHEKATWVNGEQGPPTFDAPEKLEYELHLALHAQKRGTSRVAVVKKSRLTGFPDNESLPLEYSEFAKRFGRDVIEAETHSLVLASPEQISEINKLIAKLKLSPEVVDKALGKRGVEAFEDLESVAADDVIATLKKQAENTL